MGKYSNIVLTEEDKILGSLKAFSLDVGSLRPLVSGMKYALPPKQDKSLFRDFKWAEKLKEEIAEKGGVFSVRDSADFLFNNVVGLSKQTAFEYAFRFGELNAEKVQQFFDGFQDFANGTEYSPTIVFGGDGKPVDFFPFLYRSVGGQNEKYPTVISAQEAFYDRKDRERIFGDKKRKLIAVIKKTDDKLKKRAQIISGKEKDCADMEKLRLFGELLLAYSYKIKQGEKDAEVENYYDGERAYVDALYAEVEIADDVRLLTEVEEELKKAGMIKAEKEKKKKTVKQTFITYETDGYTIRVGKNNVSNDELTFSSEGGSLWLHVKDYHSAHVVVGYRGEEFPEKVIKTACEICAYYS
ncbi:MAG: NFACT family protein, partial [Clostridia bacterium]|nr:NFACT family protein [Clostridia bacterium]